MYVYMHVYIYIYIYIYTLQYNNSNSNSSNTSTSTSTSNTNQSATSNPKTRDVTVGASSPLVNVRFCVLAVIWAVFLIALLLRGKMKLPRRCVIVAKHL